MGVAFAAVGACAVVQVKDSVDSFLQFYDATKGTPEQQKIDGFRKLVYTSNPDFYQYRLDDWERNGQDLDTELLKQLKLFESYELTFREIHAKVRDQLVSSLASFSARFPDFQMTYPVWMVHSLGVADGPKRAIAGRDVFLIGLDVIARLHPGENGAFFHHEILHLYHGQHYRQSPALFSHLWGEGLAVYVSRVLNPSATAREILLADDSGPLEEKVNPVLAALAARLLADFHSEDFRIHNKYFGSSSREPGIPPRAGYYVGYLLAQKMAGRYTIEELIQLQDDVLAPGLEVRLKTMAQPK